MQIITHVSLTQTDSVKMGFLMFCLWKWCYINHLLSVKLQIVWDDEIPTHQRQGHDGTDAAETNDAKHAWGNNVLNQICSWLHMMSVTQHRLWVKREAVCAQWQPGFWGNWSKLSCAEFEPALQAKRITAEHRPLSVSRQKSCCILRRTVSVLYVLRSDCDCSAISLWTLQTLCC